jgi:hypothetical protein
MKSVLQPVAETMMAVTARTLRNVVFAFMWILLVAGQKPTSTDSQKLRLGG